jgi:hypothetical protein
MIESFILVPTMNSTSQVVLESADGTTKLGKAMVGAMRPSDVGPLDEKKARPVSHGVL